MKNVYKYALSTNVDSALEKRVFLLYRIFYNCLFWFEKNQNIIYMYNAVFDKN